MEADSGNTVSIWMEVESPKYSSLSASTSTEVCVVGAGIAGMTTAYLLAREGKSVTVLDAGRVGGGMTSRTTAHLTSAVDDRFFEIERLHGHEGARIAAESHAAAIDRIEAIIAQEGIECDFLRLDGYLFTPPGESGDVLDKELRAAKRAGLNDVEMVERAPIPQFDTGPCLRFPGQAQFHPLKYLNGVAKAAERLGVRIFTGTRVTLVEGGTNARVETADGHIVDTQEIVIATNTPINNIFTIHTKQAPYTTYVIGARVGKGSITGALYWDTLEAYHFVRLQEVAGESYDILIVGGEDHKTGQADDAEFRYSKLERWARERFPEIQGVHYRWSGQVMEPFDGLAFIGRNPGDTNVYIATGDSGEGMTHGTIAGILITDLIMKRKSPWAGLYDPSRKTMLAGMEYLRENINVGARLVEDYISPGNAGSVEQIPLGEGRVIRRGVAKIAVYRDEQGKTHEMSAACRHLACIVHWNRLEKTWDCPCHGSRYDRYGRVINGPAKEDLAVIR